VGESKDCPMFGVPPIISETGKAMNFKLCTHIYMLNRKKTLKISGKVAVGIVSDSRTFSGHPYRAHRVVVFSIAQLSCCTGNQLTNLCVTAYKASDKIAQESRAIAGTTARCRCKFRCMSNFTTSIMQCLCTLNTATLSTRHTWRKSQHKTH